MPCIKESGYRGIRRDIEACTKDGWQVDDQDSPVNIELRESLADGTLRPEDFSFKQLFCELVEDGHRALAHFCDPNNPTKRSLVEAASTVNTAAFANITGQIMYTAIMQAYNSPMFIGDRLCRTVTTQYNGEKLPGVTDLGDVIEEINEGGKYPTAGVSEYWIETPETVKRGIIVPLTKEAVFFDRTGQVLSRAKDVGKAMGLNKEKRQLDAALGISTLYRWKGSTAQATYGDTHTGFTLDNLAGSNPLVNWASVDAAEQLFENMVDPNTGESILVTPTTIVVPGALKHTAKMVIGATDIQRGTGAAFTADPTDNIEYLTRSGNPLSNYAIETNPLVKQRTDSTSTWFIGDFQEAFSYMENWPMTVTDAPTNSYEEFHYDVMYQTKATERGTVAVVNPHAVVKCTA